MHPFDAIRLPHGTGNAVFLNLAILQVECTTLGRFRLAPVASHLRFCFDFEFGLSGGCPPGALGPPLVFSFLLPPRGAAALLVSRRHFDTMFCVSKKLQAMRSLTIAKCVKKSS